jgi:fructose-bisphosphate aldolase class II
MALVNTKKMFEMAYKNGYAVGAFNVNNMEITQGIIEGVAEEKAPLILQVSRGGRKYASLSYLRAIIDVVVEENPDIPIAINLDHGDNLETCKQFVDAGFTSVMIDASHLPFEENIRWSNMRTLTTLLLKQSLASWAESKRMLLVSKMLVSTLPIPTKR